MNRVIALQVTGILAKAGIRTQLIGSVATRGFSENDIDLVLVNFPTIDSNLIQKICGLFVVKKYTLTNWGGVLLETLTYGNVDLFPGAFMDKCFACKKDCCI